MVRCLITISLFSHLIGWPVTAAPATPFRSKVSPKIRVWMSSALLRKDRSGKPSATAPVSVRFDRIPSPAVLDRLRTRGVSFLPGNSGDVVHLGPFYAATATRRGLAALERSPRVLQVDLDVLIENHVPIDVTSKEIGAPAVWAQKIKGVPHTGKGMLIGNMDSGVDIFHPAFFKADGGLYEWLDTNNNGAFDLGIDAVDLNRDGKAGADEVLRLVEADVWDRAYKKKILTGGSGVYTPNRDWLFADTNGNKKRDFGLQAGFVETSPTYGEPLFVAEDLDRDGKLDVTEKLVALKTSKVKATSYNGVAYTRGVDLIKTQVLSTASHGTGTSGIMIGGQRGYLKWVGVAPDAELLMSTSPDDKKTSLVSRIVWLSQAKADLILHEYAPWSGYHLDGSSNHEGLMDQASKMGIAQINPAGNLRGWKKHMGATLKSGVAKNVMINVPAATYYGSHYNMHLTILWRDTNASLAFTLTDPSNASNALPINNSSGSYWGDGKTFFYSYRQDSPRGTAMMNVILYAVKGNMPDKLATGAWKLSITPTASAGTVKVIGYVSDARTSWNPGIGFTTDVSQESLICFPATADSAITVAAYAGHVGSPYEYKITGDKSGDLRSYSSRGVRVDGKHIMDIGAPDNPLTPVNHTVGYGDPGAYLVFGGTSGAGPHVAGAAILILQHNPALLGEGVRTAIHKGALVDTQVGSIPSDSWGRGKLRIYNSIYGKDPTPNTAPTVSLEMPAGVYVGTAVTLTPKASDAEDSASKLQVRWDEGYDGKYSGFVPVKPLVRTYTKVGKVRVKVQVMDSGGLTGAAAVLIDVRPAAEKPDQGLVHDSGPAGDAGAGGDDDGCGCIVAAHRGDGAVGMLPLLAFLGILAVFRRFR